MPQDGRNPQNLRLCSDLCGAIVLLMFYSLYGLEQSSSSFWSTCSLVKIMMLFCLCVAFTKTKLRMTFGFVNLHCLKSNILFCLFGFTVSFSNSFHETQYFFVKELCLSSSMAQKKPSRCINASFKEVPNGYGSQPYTPGDP